MKYLVGLAFVVLVANGIAVLAHGEIVLGIVAISSAVFLGAVYVMDRLTQGQN